MTTFTLIVFCPHQCQGQAFNAWRCGLFLLCLPQQLPSVIPVHNPLASHHAVVKVEEGADALLIFQPSRIDCFAQINRLLGVLLLVTLDRIEQPRILRRV